MIEMITSSGLAFLLNAFYAIGVICLTVGVFMLLDRFIFREINFAQALKQDNRAVAIVVAAAFISVALVASAAFSSELGKMPDKYDHHFRKYSHRFFSRAVDWQWFRAQAMAESSFDHAALSPVGARGLMQLMPPTSREMADRLGIPDMPLHPRYAIMMGIAYDRRMWGIWQAERGVERIRYMLASYNAGPGHIIAAQRIAPCPARWECIATVLEQITGRHAEETIHYVARIEALMDEG